MTMAMDVKKAIAAFDACRRRLPPGTLPERFGQSDQHLAFMCEEGRRLIAEGRREKAMRCLGFVQGALWADDRASIDELKEMNRPVAFLELLLAGQWVRQVACTPRNVEAEKDFADRFQRAFRIVDGEGVAVHEYHPAPPKPARSPWSSRGWDPRDEGRG
jgi:hypothetical protein